MFMFLFQHTPRRGENLIDRPFGRFAVPIAQLPSGSFLIPNDHGISLLEFTTVRLRAYNRTHARRISLALCLAGVPVFDEPRRIRIYCPRMSARTIFEAFNFSSDVLSPGAETLRNYAEIGDIAALSKLCGAVEYELKGGDVVIEKARRYPLPKGAALL